MYTADLRLLAHCLELLEVMELREVYGYLRVGLPYASHQHWLMLFLWSAGR